MNIANERLEQCKIYLQALQNTFCQTAEAHDGQAQFVVDDWQEDSGFKGYGSTRILQDGQFERAGVGFSCVQGDALPQAATASREHLAGRPFSVVGVSMILHPHNPYVPTMHMNLRFFTTTDDDPIWWFGGGMDLTPFYGFEEDAKHWHEQCRQACLPFGDGIYEAYKKWCDEYFYLPHRQEARGVGGLFFDDVNHWDFETCFKFMTSVGDHIVPAYFPIMERRQTRTFGQRERDFQAYRRGRYVEFNLLYDRGTLFGLQSGGRVESILMSMPPAVNWRYNYQPEPGSDEAKLYTDFLPVRNWVMTTDELVEQALQDHR